MKQFVSGNDFLVFCSYFLLCNLKKTKNTLLIFSISQFRKLYRFFRFSFFYFASIFMNIHSIVVNRVSNESVYDEESDVNVRSLMMNYLSCYSKFKSCDLIICSVRDFFPIFHCWSYRKDSYNIQNTFPHFRIENVTFNKKVTAVFKISFFWVLNIFYFFEYS